MVIHPHYMECYVHDISHTATTRCRQASRVVWINRGDRLLKEAG